MTVQGHGTTDGTDGWVYASTHELLRFWQLLDSLLGEAGGQSVETGSHLPCLKGPGPWGCAGATMTLLTLMLAEEWKSALDE